MTTRVSSSNNDAPLGHCLLARDTTQNRQLFPNGPFGNEPIKESICPNGGPCPHYSYQEDTKDTIAIQTTPIHVLIASFRDRLCGRTLHNAFQHAEYPHRLFFRVIQQTQSDSELEDDMGCWDYYCQHYNSNCQEYQDQVRIVPVDSKESKGPTWARSKLSAMIEWDYKHQNSDLDFVPVQLQDFCMQIDSHMDFSDHFDVELIDMFHQTQNDYAVLSTYVTDIEENNKDPKNVPNLCMVTFTSSIRNWATKECVNLKKPKLTNAMWGAGLSFHRCHAEINVPVDPYLDNVFDGEEGSRGIRFFTHGYDVYTPHRVLVTHDYHGHQSNPVVHTWGHTDKNNKKAPWKQQESNWKWMEEIDQARNGLTVFGSNRVNLLLGIGNEDPALATETELIRHSRYGLGTKRTLTQAIEFTGINLRERRMEVNKCGNLEWVPFKESPNYGVEELLSRGRASEVVTPFVLLKEGGNSGGTAQQEGEMALNSNATPQRIRFNAAGRGLPVTASNNTVDYALIGGLSCAALALLIRISTRKRTKNDKHKN
jgi:Glycosyltransferase (GlcNAc)